MCVFPFFFQRPGVSDSWVTYNLPDRKAINPRTYNSPMYSLLCVDDEPGQLEVSRLFLDSTGEFVISTARSGKEALDQLGRHEYDAIISDYQMPGMDGIALLKNVRATERDIPFILFTGKGREEVVIEAINNGADFYIQKGGDPMAQFTELAHKVRQAIVRRRTERSLKNSEEFLNSVIEQSPNPMWISDSRGTLIRLNQACRDMLQITDDDVVGKYNVLQDNIVEEQGYMPLVRRVFEAGEVARFPLEYDSAKLSGLSLGRTVKRYLAVTIFPIRDIEGTVTNAVIQHIDITAMKQAHAELLAAYEQLSAAEEELREQYDLLVQSGDELKESEERYRILTDVAFRGVFIIDGSGTILAINPSIQRIFGIPDPAMVMGKNVLDFVSQESREMVINNMQSVMSGKKGYREKVHCRTLAGRDLWIETIGARIPYRKQPAMIVAIPHITERKPD